MEKLTPREEEILKKILHGYQEKHIAKEFNISVRTVSSITRNIRFKLDETDTVHAAYHYFNYIPKIKDKKLRIKYDEI